MELQLIMDKQKSLHDFYAEKHPKSYYHHGPFRYPYEKLVLGIQAIEAEFAEIMKVIPWKWWKERGETGFYIHFQFNGVSSEDDATKEQFLKGIKEYLEMELIDVGHFYLDMLSYMGIDAERFWKLYLEKNKENFDRQDRGY